MQQRIASFLLQRATHLSVGHAAYICAHMPQLRVIFVKLAAIFYSIFLLVIFALTQLQSQATLHFSHMNAHICCCWPICAQLPMQNILIRGLALIAVRFFKLWPSFTVYSGFVGCSMDCSRVICTALVFVAVAVKIARVSPRCWQVKCPWQLKPPH